MTKFIQSKFSIDQDLKNLKVYKLISDFYKLVALAILSLPGSFTSAKTNIFVSEGNKLDIFFFFFPTYTSFQLLN